MPSIRAEDEVKKNFLAPTTCSMLNADSCPPGSDVLPRTLRQAGLWPRRRKFRLNFDYNGFDNEAGCEGAVRMEVVITGGAFGIGTVPARLFVARVAGVIHDRGAPSFEVVA